MASKPTYLVTGANRGIGFGLTRALLLRPNNIVIATIRNPTTAKDDLSRILVADGSKLILEHYSPDVDSAFTASSLASNLKTKHCITSLNTLIANLGIGNEFLPSLAATPESILSHIQTNTLAPISLYQSLHPLLSKSANPKFILISSSLGSIQDMEGAAPTLAYGISKAGANYFVRKVHFEDKKVVSVAVHPGWAKTGNGQCFADAIGVKEPPMTLEESAEGVLKGVDNSTKEGTSGCFVSYDGSII